MSARAGRWTMLGLALLACGAPPPPAAPDASTRRDGGGGLRLDSGAPVDAPPEDAGAPDASGPGPVDAGGADAGRSDAGAEDASPACTPACAGRACGDDGCGGSCGSCGPGASCASGRCTLPACTPSDCPAFPGAEGFGSRTRGGRGGDVYRVTTLADSGPGSLREGIASARGPRTIVFAVAGTIPLSSELTIDRDELTLAGETAPGDGILLRGATVRITSRQVIVRHLRFRRGASGDSDAVWITGATDVILDHVSASWGRDESLSITRAFDRVTVQDSIIAEDVRADHQYGTLVACDTEGGALTLLRNAYVNQAGRTPRAASRDRTDFLLQMVNNVVYNWGTRGDWGTWATSGDEEHARWNMVGNLHIAGPDSRAVLSLTPHARTILSCNGGRSSIYLEGNRIDSDRDGVLDPVDADWGNVRGGCGRANTPHAVPAWAALRAMPAADALAAIVAGAGARPWARDAVDQRLIRDLQTWGSGGEVRTSPAPWPTLAGGTAPADADADGMPDAWEQRAGLDPADPADRNGDVDGDGYTNLEGYLHYMATPPSARPF